MWVIWDFFWINYCKTQIVKHSSDVCVFQVLVRSIIDQDPLRQIDESNLVWSNEEDDEKVDNMVYLINTNFQFTRSMFVGGATKLDVDRMR